MDGPDADLETLGGSVDRESGVERPLDFLDHDRWQGGASGLFFDRAKPAMIRLRIISRSKSAKTESIPNIARPDGVTVRRTAE